MGKLQTIKDKFIAASQPDFPEQPAPVKSVTAGEVPNNFRQLMQEFNVEIVATFILGFASPEKLLRRLQAREVSLKQEIARVEKLRSLDNPPLAESNLDPRVAQLLANPDSRPVETDDVPGVIERLYELWDELTKVRLALHEAKRPLATARGRIQDALKKQLLARYKAMVAKKLDVIRQFYAVEDEEMAFHSRLAELGFPMWGRLARLCSPAFTDMAESWRKSMWDSRLIDITQEELLAILHEREVKAADSANLASRLPEEVDVSLPQNVISTPFHIGGDGTDAMLQPASTIGSGIPKSGFELPQVGPGQNFFSHLGARH
jgi:hypothetical protein